MYNLIPAVAIGLFAGVLAGMFGIGGGVVIVPALIIFLGYQLSSASGTSLAALLLPVSIFATMQYYKAGFLSIKTSAKIALGLVTGVFFGAKIALSVDPFIMKSLYGVFLLYTFYNFADLKSFFTKNKQSSGLDVDENVEDKTLALLGLGLLAGVLSGMFGIGGGLIITPFLMGVLKFSPKKAIGTSLGALLAPVGLPGVIAYQQADNLNILVACGIAFGLVFGSIAGAKITIGMSSKKIKTTYGYFLLVIGSYFIYQGVSGYLSK